MFFEQWKASSTPPYKCQEMVERASPASIATVGAVTRLANLGVEHGYLDPSPCNEAGAGYFCYASNAGEQTVLVMARIEGNPQNMAQFRVTVVSQAPQVSAQLKDLISATALLPGQEWHRSVSQAFPTWGWQSSCNCSPSTPSFHVTFVASAAMR
ncbi:alpha_adaptinC2 domain-containing protein, partial [Haematococcus lacustris]